MCSISSITTLRMMSAASTLVPSSMEYSAQRYAGMVACSSMTACCRASRSRLDAGRVELGRAHASSSAIAAAVRQASAASVSVGLEVPIVGMLPAPTTNRFRWSQLRWSGSTT